MGEGEERKREHRNRQRETIDHKVPEVGRNKVQTLGLLPFQLLVPPSNLFCLSKLEWVPFVSIASLLFPPPC